MIGRWTSWCVVLFVLFLFVLQTMGFAEERYTVKPGDNLYKISKTYGVSIDTLKASNHLEKESLRLNQILLIPASKGKQGRETVKKPSGQINSSTPRPEGRNLVKNDPERRLPAPPSKIGNSAVQRVNSYVVKKGDSLFSISKKVGVSVEEMKRINQLHTNHLMAGQTLTLSIPRNATEDPDEELGDTEGVQEDSPEEGEEEQAAAVPPDEAASTEPASGRWRNQEERSLFVRVVKNFLGVPYRLGGSTLKGIDCSAFVKRIYEIFNTRLPRTTWEQLRIGKRIGKGDLEEGDLVFFKVATRRASNRHVGIYIGNNEFVHASSRNREVRVDNLEAPYFSTRFINGVRVKELDRKL